MNTPDTIPDRAELPPLPEPIEINWPTMHASGLGCGVEDRGLRGRYECAEYGWQEGVDAAADSVPEEIYTADQMREYALAARSLAGTPQAEPLKAAPDAVSERLHEFRVRLCEYGVAMYHEQSQKAKVLADVLSSMLEAALSTTQQAAKSAAASACPLGLEGSACVCGVRVCAACVASDAAAHSAAPAAVGEHRARLLFLADCIDRNPRIEHDADDATYFRELAAFFSAPMPAGAAVGEAPRVAKPAPPSDIELLKVYTRMHQGQRVPESKRDLFLKYARIGIAATTPTTGGASTPTGEGS